MKKFILSIMTFLVTPFILLAGEITVIGNGTVSLPATTGYITVAVVTESKTPAGALAANKDATSNIFELLKKLNIKKEELQTQDFNLSPKYINTPNQDPTLTGYIAKYTLQVTVCDIANTGEILDDIVKEGANRVEGVRFGINNEKMQEALTLARVDAAKNAKYKAELFASALNLKGKLKLKTLAESSVDSGRNMVYAASLLQRADKPTNLEGGEISVKVQVHTVWECD